MYHSWGKKKDGGGGDDGKIAADEQDKQETFPPRGSHRKRNRILMEMDQCENLIRDILTDCFSH